MMIRKLFIGLAFAVALVGCEKVHAEVAIPEPTGFLTDLTGTIPSQSVGALEIKNKAIELQQSPATRTVVMTLIVPTTDGEGVSDFAQRVAEAWHPGSKSEERGVVLVISKGDKSWAIKTSREVSSTLTDYNAKHLLSQMGQYIKSHKGDFAGAVALFYSEIPQYLKAPPLPEPVASSASVAASTAHEDAGISGWIWFSLFGLFAVSGLLLLRHWFKQQEAKAQLQAEAEEEIVSRIRQRNQEQQDAAREARNTNMYSSQPHREAPVRKPSPVPPPIDNAELDRRQADLIAEQTRKRREQEQRARDAANRRTREETERKARERQERNARSFQDDDSPATDFAASILAGALAGSMSSRSRSEPEPERESRTTYSAPEPEPDRGGNTESYDGGGASGTFGD